MVYTSKKKFTIPELNLFVPTTALNFAIIALSNSLSITALHISSQSHTTPNKMGELNDLMAF